MYKKTLFHFLIIFFLAVNINIAQIVAGYYYASNTSYPHAAIDYDNLTHIIHAFVRPNSDGSLTPDSWYHYPELITTAHENGVKILTALGGWGNSGGFPSLAADSVARDNFISNIINFCQTYGYDGIDIDWEYPGGNDKANFVTLVKMLRAEMDNAGLELLTAAIPSTDWQGGYDINELEKYLDWFGIMTYDFYGPWETKSGHHSPLYSSPSQYSSTDRSVNYYLSKGMPKEKLLIGIPFYGYDFTAPGLFKTHSGAVSSIYANIKIKMESSWEYYWDNTPKAPYLMNNTKTHTLTFDDSVSIKLKSEYIRKNNLAGTIIWKIGHDYTGTTTPLLDIVGKYIMNHPKNAPIAPKLFMPENNTEVDTNSILLEWFPSDSTTSYNLQTSQSNGFEYTLENVTDLLFPKFKLNNLQNNKTYYWRVSSVNLKGISKWSEPSSFQVNYSTTDVHNNIENEFKINLNVYPNPFNPSTKISFDLPAFSKVSLKVYNSLGEEKAELINDNLNSGNHQINFNANGYSSGIYFIRLNASYKNESNEVKDFNKIERISFIK